MYYMETLGEFVNLSAVEALSFCSHPVRGTSSSALRGLKLPRYRKRLAGDKTLFQFCSLQLSL